MTRGIGSFAAKGRGLPGFARARSGPPRRYDGAAARATPEAAAPSRRRRESPPGGPGLPGALTVVSSRFS
jgi:hypothetical protein